MNTNTDTRTPLAFVTRNGIAKWTNVSLWHADQNSALTGDVQKAQGVLNIVAPGTIVLRVVR